jgi:hypothetical protein
VSIRVAGAVAPGRPISPVEDPNRSARPDNLARHDWKQARAYVLAFTGLALGAYVHCRGLGRRGERRGAPQNRGMLGMTPPRHHSGARLGRVDA